MNQDYYGSAISNKIKKDTQNLMKRSGPIKGDEREK
jgi:hypothetical protein